mmetsp:Transcript_14466/g.37524  ORF Transcript_14466/g.37524 Transcript_14466/m.37524 type:complete len:526 (-) Transcript_14466:99-1676(-)
MASGDCGRLSVANGLLVRLAGRWLWSTDTPDDHLLLEAASMALDRALPEYIVPLFGSTDPWRSRPSLGAIAEFLGTDEVGRLQHAESVHAPKTVLNECVDVRLGTHDGRGIYASKQITSGEVLLHERAHAAVIWNSAKRTHCDHCIRPLAEKLSTSSLCVHQGGSCLCSARYCSLTCSEAAWSDGHAVECGSHFYALAPRTVVLCVRALLAATSRSAAVPHESNGSSTSLAYAKSSDALAAILTLQDHGPEMHAARASQVRFHAHLAFTAMGCALEARGHSEASLCLLLRLALTNVFAVSTLRCTASVADAGVATKPVLEEMRKLVIGEAFFARASLFNHSCRPNTATSFDGRELTVRAIANTLSSTQMWTSYGLEAGFATVATRRKVLRDVYFFDCQCSACSHELTALMPTMREDLDIRQYAQVLDHEARDASEEGQFARAAALSERAIALLMQVFPSGSPVLAYEYAKLARLRFNAVEDAQTAEAARLALHCGADKLETCFGVSHDEARELRRLEHMLGRHQG